MDNSLKFIAMKYCSIILLAVFLSACYYDKESYLYPTDLNCDTQAVSYQADIVPILDGKCMSCHGALVYTSLGGNVALEPFDKLLIQVNNGKLLSSVKQDGNASAMPKNATKLNSCSIALLEAWINQGAQQN